jgi:hypothetical protein
VLPLRLYRPTNQAALGALETGNEPTGAMRCDGRAPEGGRLTGGKAEPAVAKDIARGWPPPVSCPTDIIDDDGPSPASFARPGQGWGKHGDEMAVDGWLGAGWDEAIGRGAGASDQRKVVVVGIGRFRSARTGRHSCWRLPQQQRVPR